MTGGRILAVHEGQEGVRPILNVQGFFHRNQPEATIFYGQVLMFPQTVVTTRIPDYIMFMDTLKGVSTTWAQMRRIPYETPTDYYYQMIQARGAREGLETIQHAPMTLNAAGYDGLRGFWLDFQGISPLFQQPRWWEDGSEGGCY